MTSSDDSRVIERRTLLHELRSIVEGLLDSQVSNVWNVYGGLNRLHNCIEKIFRHGSRVFDSTGDPDCWVFIQGLNWLQPSLATSPSVHESDDYLSNLPARISSKKDLLWIYKSLENHSLSPRLSWLLSDKEHLLSCLEPWAFLRQENLAEATLICLQAVEKNQPILLTEIDPCLFLPNGNMMKNSPKRHQRSSSYPTNLPYASRKTCNASRNDFNKIQETSSDFTTKPSRRPMIDEMRSKINSDPTISKSNSEKNNLAKVWNSLPSLSEKSSGNYQIEKTRAKFYVGSKDQTMGNVGLSNVIKIDYADVTPTASDPSSVEAKSKKSPPRKIRKKVKISGYEKRGEQTTSQVDGWIPTIEKMPKSNMRHRRSMDLEMIDARNTSNSSSSTIKIVTPRIVGKRKSWRTLGQTESTPEFSSSWTSEIEGQKVTRTPRKTFMEDGGSSVQPMATGYFPRPTEGQSLTSFLSSAQFSRANAELDRENAHFSISEAMIAAIEQVKCNGQIDLADETIEESDEEINRLKQRIRLRRRQRQQERRRVVVWNRDLLSDGKTDTTTTDQSVSPLSSSPETPSEGILTDDVEDLEVDDVKNLSDLGNSGISISMASLYSEAELHRSMPSYNKESTLTESIISAEGVALSLIRRFSEKQLPRASELEWLVSEQDAPQQLLPLPLSWPVSPDELESENMTLSTPLRGTMEWAPPRAQIIFTPQPKPERRSLMGKQNYRCAGCGMKVAVEYANRFRYCEYLGRYFCTGCHTNQLAMIPGKILQKWNFNRYSVSNFSYRLLDQMSSDPLFHVNDLCPMLYRRVKQLERCRLLRTQLFYLKDFIYVCRFAEDAQEALRKEPTYVVNDPHVYAIQDFVRIKIGDLSERLKELVLICSLHVSGCELCQARGFVCELCCSKEIIFPWHLTKVARCDNCGACFHTECRRVAAKKECPRCARLAERRSSRNENC